MVNGKWVTNGDFRTGPELIISEREETAVPGVDPVKGSRVVRNVKPTYWSLNRIKNYQAHPLRSIINEYVVKGNRASTIQTDDAGVGTQAHSAIEYGLKKVMEARQQYSSAELSQDTKVKILEEACKHANTKLSLAGANDLNGYVSDVIHLFGMKYLTNSKDVILLEKQLESSKIANGALVGGRMDMIYFDRRNNLVMVPDWKTGLGGMGDAEKLGEHMATKVYTTVVKDNLEHIFEGTDEKTKIAMMYVVAPDEVKTHKKGKKRKTSRPRFAEPHVDEYGDEPARGFKNIHLFSYEMSDEEIDKSRAEIDTTIRSINTLITERVEPALRSPIKGTLTRLIADMVKNGECNPAGNYGCERCSIKYLCPMSKIQKEFLANDMSPAPAHISLSSVEKKRKSIQTLLLQEKKKEFSPFGETRRLIKDATDRSSTLFEVSREKAEDGTINTRLNDYEDFLGVVEQDYLDEISRYGRAAAFRKISFDETHFDPYSFLDPKFRPNWLTPHMQATLRAQRDEHLSMLTSMHGSAPANLVRHEIARDLGKETVLQKEMSRIVHQGIRQSLGDQGIVLTEKNINEPAIKAYISRAYTRHSDETLSKISETLRNHISEKFADGILHYDPDSVLEKYTTPEIRQEYKSEVIASYLKGEIKRDIKSLKTPTDWAGELRKGMSTDSLLGRYHFVGKRKIPAGTAFATYATSYLAATLTSHKRNEDNIKRAAELAAQQYDITGQDHLSPYSLIMRLTGTDFGSKTRSGFRVSDRLAAWATSSERYLRDMKDTISIGASEFFSKNAPGYDPTALNVKAAAVMERLAGWGIRASPLMMSAAAVTAAAVVLGGFLTGGASDEVAEEKRYQRTLKKARLVGEERARIIEQESETRRQTLLHTPYAFSVIPRILQSMSWNIAESADEAVKLITSKASRLYAAMMSKGDFSYIAHEATTSGRLARLASELSVVPEGGGEMIRRSAGRLQGSLVSQTQKVNRVVSSSRSRLYAERALASTERELESAGAEAPVRRLLDKNVQELLTAPREKKPAWIMKARSRRTPVFDFIEPPKATAPITMRPRVRLEHLDYDELAGISTRTSAMSTAMPIRTNRIHRVLPYRGETVPAKGIISGSTDYTAETLAAKRALSISASHENTLVPPVPVISPAFRLPFADPRVFMHNPRLMGGRGTKAIPGYSGWAPLPRDLV